MSLHKSLAMAGGTATAVGGGVLVSKSSLFQDTPSPTTSQQKETFRQKYSSAILGSEDALWETKFSGLSGNAQPTHEKLKEAKTKHTSHSDEAKTLHKEGCQAIYDSEWEGSSYLNDFKSYCSKTVADAMKDVGTWIDQEGSVDGKWNTKLTNLSKHDENQDGALNDTLKNLKTSLTPTPSAGTSSNWDANKRTTLNNWCKEVKVSVFMGDADTQFKHAKLYCVEEKAASLPSR
ncbi:hypothetical protein HF1_08890 [Mycoplasma haemofelis str. Langford 1]|uniref:Uncharacterized protein n=1 Tax=Mycoplasma haemofelis (strain Langford 1) TaxID=941640 RepID=E8ZIC6_MYCHL|nr:hypothetical protein [Mycoplasma haemofelis]CBY92897.1 hypothetical protein HF1_08890 [Mycoplasma haemofelis str. Langford 1]